MEDGSTSRTSRLEVAEPAFFAGAALSICILALYRFLLPRLTGIDIDSGWFEFPSAVTGVILGALNFRSWSLFIRIAAMPHTNPNARGIKELMTLILLKGVVIAALIYMLFTGSADKILSLVFGFSLFLFSGLLIVISLHLIRGEHRAPQ